MPDFLMLGNPLVDVGPTALISPLCKAVVQPTEKVIAVHTAYLLCLLASRRPSHPKIKTQHDSVDDVTVES